MAETKIPHPNIKKLHLIKRDRSRFFYARFFHKGERQQISTECDNQKEAEKVAEAWYLEQQARIINGTLPTRETKEAEKKPTIKDASIIAIKDLRLSVRREEHSAEYLRGVIMVMNKHILTHHWQDVPCEEVTNAMWKRYLREAQAERAKNDEKPIARRTFHQIRNALRMCLKVAESMEWITKVPDFTADRGSHQETAGRAWFEPKEQRTLLKALDENIKDLEKTRHHESAKELRDYVEFLMYTGLRVSESKNVRFKDIQVAYTDDEKRQSTLIIKNIKGKRGVAYESISRPEAVATFEGIKKRRGIKNHGNCDELLFLEHHRTGFNALLTRLGMKYDDRNRRRDFVSLRHTYICNMIRNQVSVYLIATNCRTSVDIIEKHYAKPMNVSLNAGELIKDVKNSLLIEESKVNRLF
ncbi:MAG: hypothetical protein CMK83_24015 [Pseudomonadales bacterium]|nr:hypothetical protein [Pseudomonadales bacterium]MBI27123.1 hypothetical protein [Pseudomonadales bacterium]HAG96789.1 hypothetical protein [Gammaproteobacteria bacterium]HBO95581.1 hypothetical protein [Gammaproteobacteria bacterium]|tara:strand:+ start:45367 stop:46608 length:1242 start_codon:yes stop_codon:yes gene_type:complete